MKALIYIFVFISLFVLTSSSSHETGSPFVGLWHDNSIFMYSCSLGINADGSFTFRDRGCTERRYSKGKWSSDKVFIALLSYKKYYKLRQKTLSAPYTSDSAKSNSFPGIDSIAMYFDNVRFELANDTLYQLNASGERKGLKLTKQ